MLVGRGAHQPAASRRQRTGARRQGSRCAAQEGAIFQNHQHPWRAGGARPSLHSRHAFLGGLPSCVHSSQVQRRHAWLTFKPGPDLLGQCLRQQLPVPPCMRRGPAHCTNQSQESSLPQVVDFFGFGLPDIRKEMMSMHHTHDAWGSLVPQVWCSTCWHVCSRSGPSLRQYGRLLFEGSCTSRDSGVQNPVNAAPNIRCRPSSWLLGSLHCRPETLLG